MGSQCLDTARDGGGWEGVYCTVIIWSCGLGMK